MAIKKPWNRAKIFQPFDALPGLRELLHQKERKHETQFDEHGNEAIRSQDTAPVPPESQKVLPKQIRVKPF